MKELTSGQIKDVQVLARFIELYCRAHHDRETTGRVAIDEILCQVKGIGGTLCPDCAELLEHGIKKRALCPLDPKPACKNCHIHCYSKEYRQKIREIMAFSGKRMILRGRLDYLWHYFMKK